MNWTGGSLQRHSKKATKSIVNRQRQHFAKVRTTLQNGSNTVSVPFRPSYLRAKDASLGGRLPSFGSGSVRHAGHSKRLHRQRRENEDSPPQIRPHRNHRNSAERVFTLTGSRREHRADSHDKYAVTSPSNQACGNSTYATERKRKVPDTEIENQLLEANRRRMLQRQDWVGLAPQRPVDMYFSAMKEKDRIGKRRKINGHPILRNNVQEKFIQQPAHASERHPGPYMGATLRNEVKDIRIRIGTDALASQILIQQNEHALSQKDEPPTGDTSDPMLFDNEDLYSAPKESLQPLRSVTVSRNISAAPGINAHARLHPQLTLGETIKDKRTIDSQNNSRDRRGELHSDGLGGLNAMERHQILHGSVERHAHSSNEDIGPSFLVTQDIGGVVPRPVRLIFDQHSDFSEGIGVIEPPIQGENAKEFSPRQTNAKLPVFGDSRANAGNERVVSNKTWAHLSSIVDDSPWQAFVDIPNESSSHSTTTNASRSVLSQTLQQQPVEENIHEFGPAAWSQRATQGDQTCVGASSSISASFPSIRHADELSTPRRPWHVGSRSGHETSGRQSHDMDEDNRIWKTFLFGGDNNLMSNATSRYGDEVAEGQIPTASVKERPDLLPSCAAVASSASSKVFPTLPESASRHASCISDSVQHAMDYWLSSTSPGSKSQSFISPIQQAYAGKNDRWSGSSVQEYPDGEHSTGKGERSDYGGGQSVTHAFLFNDVSHSTFSSGTFGSGLEQCGRVRSRSFGPLLVKRSGRNRRDENSSIYDIPVTDSEG